MSTHVAPTLIDAVKGRPDREKKGRKQESRKDELMLTFVKEMIKITMQQLLLSHVKI